MFSSITSDQVGGAARAVITWGGGVLAAHGFGDGTLWQTIAGGGALIVGGLWSWYTNRAAKVVNIDTGKPKSVTP